LSGPGNFGFTTSNNHLEISATGHDEWATIQYDFNDGNTDKTINLLQATGAPIQRIRVRASSPCVISATLMANSITAQNPILKDRKEIELSYSFKVLEINFDGLLWDEWVNAGTTLDQSIISKIILAVNPGYASFPRIGSTGTVYNSQFVGNIEIDWIRFGQDCKDCLLIPNGIAEMDQCGECLLVDDTEFDNCTITGLEAESIQEHELVWPNQFSNHTYLHTENLGTGPFNYQVLDINGHTFISGNCEEDSKVPLGTSLHNGLYFVMISNGKDTWTTKIIKQ
jgi:hypothetical protein